jgi:PAS domain S-box-containing protein
MTKTTILLVEDEAIVAADLASKLKQFGYEIVGTTGSGEEAIELARCLLPRLVLMDIRLKGPLDGIAAAEAIRRQQDVPVIYLTAHSDAATLDRAKLSDPFGFILKPFEERELSTTIEMALYKHQSDRQLREQQEWLRVTLASIGDAVITCDTDGRTTFLNPVAESLTGWSIDEARYLPIRKVFHLINEQTRQPSEDAVALVLGEGRPKTLADHTVLVTRDGREIPIEDSASPILAADGRLIGAVFVFHDVSEKRRAGEALRKYYDELEMCVEKRTQELKELSDTLEEQVIERTAQLKSANEILRSSRVAALNLMEDAVIARREAEETSDRLRLEIAERKQVEKALRESELFYSQTLESIPGMVFTTRPDGFCDYQSRQWEEFTGVPVSKQLGEGWNRLLHPDDRPRAYAAWRSAVEGRTPYDLEYRVRRHDGEYEWFKIISRPISDAAGQIVKWFGVAANIDQIKRGEVVLQQAKEAAEVASRAKSQFLANMSHELRTPMTGVLGMLEITLNGALDNDQRKYIEMADRSARSLLQILNDILDLTKIEAGMLTMEEKPIDLRECVTGVIDILIPEARRKGLSLLHTMSLEPLEMVVGDQLRLRQILTNLVGNAVKFTEKGKVEVTVQRGRKMSDGRRQLTFSVTDTGIGIPADKRDILFNVFTQADESHSRRYGGTGLGLAICRELVERMGGTITCESTLGVGSSFSFTIPFREAGPERVSAAESVTVPSVADTVSPGAEGEKFRLLIAEDDEITRKILGLMLQRAGFDFEFAGDGRQAVEMWQQGEYDLVVMDGQMPFMDGFTAAATIRELELERGGHIPIVAMTAHALSEDEDRCLSAGMDAYISKPIDVRKSIDLITQLIARRRDHRHQDD